MEDADTMAANSGGVDWPAILMPLLVAKHETVNKADLLELCSGIVKSETEILRHKESNRTFYSSFAVLAADYISTSVNNLTGSQLETVSAASRVLLGYLLSSLSSSGAPPDPAHVERCLHAVRVLCVGAPGPLSHAEVSRLVNTMRGDALPPTPVPAPSPDPAAKQEAAKGRSDLGMRIHEQLVLPLRGADDPGRVSADPSSTDPAGEITKLFLKTNTESLQSLRAGDTIVDLCLNLPSIKKSRTKVEEALAGKPFSIPITHSEATTLRACLPSTLSEMSLASSALQLPVLEPLTPGKLDKLCMLSMAVLQCAIGQACASAVLQTGVTVQPKSSTQQPPPAAQKEEELEANAVTLIEEALGIYSFIGGIIKASTRAGGHVFQNHLLAGAWVLVSGLQAHMSACVVPDKAPHLRERDDKSQGRSPSKGTQPGSSAGSSKSGLMKLQQSFGVLSVALASKALSLLGELFEDLHLEVCAGASSVVQVEPAPLAIMGQFTALQRVARVLGAAPLNHLLFYLAIVSYRKACTLKRLHPPEGDTYSQSDSTTYYEDMILCSETSSTDEDDDSEMILGQWFEETVAPPEPAEARTPTAESGEARATDERAAGGGVVPEKGEAHGFISLATGLFLFMNRHLLCSRSAYVARYVKAGLSEQQMIILAAIVRDLDRETARTDVGTISVYFGTNLAQLYCDFSGALSRFTHNLITHNGLTGLQACLLNHLGVSPWNTDVPHAWPLQVYPRTLSVLAQVLLLRPQNEKEASVISIWHRLVNTLIENVLNTPQTIADAENEDLNVEHAQVLLYLFHSLNLMQKKSVVLLMAGGVLRCSEISRGPLKESQLLHLSRLLLLFDYIMKHLYDAPTALLEQIQWNLFYSTNLNVDSEKKNMSRMYTAWQEIEDNYRKITSGDEFAMKPRFYVLTNLEINNQDAPKLDGLACNFILGTPDKLRYPLLLDALIEILNITHVTSVNSSSKISFLGLCATQYCFTICWRLLQLLPPSGSYMERLAAGEILAAGPLLLHSLIWGPRTSHKNFNRWLKDCLVKQGMYTQHTDKLLKAVSDAVNNIKYDISNAKNCVITLTPDVKQGLLHKENLPPLMNLILLDTLMAKVRVSLEDPENNSNETIVSSNTTLVQDLLPHVLKLTQAILHCTRWALLHTAVDQSESASKTNLKYFEGVQDILAVASTLNLLTNTLATELGPLLPTAVSSVQQQWNSSTVEDLSWKPYENDIIPSESYILKILDTHICSLSMNSPFSINLSLKRLLQCLVKFLCDHAPKIENTDTKNKAIETLVSITLDLRMEFLYETVSKTLDKMIGDSETDEHQKRVYLRVLEHTYRLIINYSSQNSPNYSAEVDEKVLHSCLKFYEKILEKSSGRQALENFFTGDKDLVKVLLSVSNLHMSQQYSTRVLHFFNKLFQTAEKSSTDPSLNYLCSSMSKLAKVDGEKLQAWLKQVIIGPNMPEPEEESSKTQPQSSANVTLAKNESPSTNVKWTIAQVTVDSSSSPDDKKSLVQENSQLLQALTSFIVKQNNNVSEEVPLTILKALIPLGCHILSPPLEGCGFTDLMVVMTMLADAGTGKGHVHLFPATAEWLELCNRSFASPETSAAASINITKPMIQAACCIVDYVSDVVGLVTAQGQAGGGTRALSPPWEGETPLEIEGEWPEEEGEDDSGDDSDEDSLCNKLCTFTITQKEFMNQHWYHCHTCRMLDGVGVCSVCARVCHKGHDLSYAKYGNFFCDCGAKEDATCQALVRRSPQTESNAAAAGASSTVTPASTFTTEGLLQSSLRRRPSSPVPIDKTTYSRDKRDSGLVKQMEGAREFIAGYLGSEHLAGNLVQVLTTLLPSIESNCNQMSPVGCHARAMAALQQLHTVDKKYVQTDQLMVPTLGSQEGAFENVRMSYAGEQGQTIRQLLSAHIIRRVAMCCMTSTHGRRQHLAVSHEKGKITVLQLSALLKQADSSTRKLTLTRLSSAPIPFTVLSLSSNLCNEDYLAVCGLKDCHVLTFTSGGSVSDHLVLHPQLETGNFIIKAVWLPGSQTKLALVTADFVKVYDLALDALSPQYYFLVPSGKIRDCTFMYEDGIYNILLMSSPGHIYVEKLKEDSSAKYGSFYVTNTLEVFHLDVTDVNGQVAGGGVSIYYSHTLGLLFYSYALGKSFVSPMSARNSCLTVVFPISLPTPAAATATTAPAGGKSNGQRNPTPQPLCQWTEIPNHPGLLCAAMQSSNNPVVIMLKPDTLLFQEIRVVPSKSKIMDMVAIRHNSGNELRTTLILLCEDGSLKMYMANMDQTGFWMSPTIRPTLSGGPAVKPRKKKSVKTGKTSSSVAFPVDFFEHCQPMNDVEFGGNDLLQVYNISQLKHRLNTTGLYVSCNKPLGFTIEVTNNESNMVMTGVRVLVGSQDVQKAPSFIEVLGRIISLTVTRSRWVDVPLSHEESLQAEKKLNIMFGPSQDPETTTMVDSIKIYGKTKDAFGWPEETEEATTPANNTAQQPANPAGLSTASDTEVRSKSAAPLNRLDRLVMGVLESLEGIFSSYTTDALSTLKTRTLAIATDLITLPTQRTIQMHSKGLLCALHVNKQAYHNYKDQAILHHVASSLKTMVSLEGSERMNIDAENFYRLVLLVRGIAIVRPQNLVKFTDSASMQELNFGDPLAPQPAPPTSSSPHLLHSLLHCLWTLHALCPTPAPAVAPVAAPGLRHAEQTVHALVEIVHAYASCSATPSDSSGSSSSASWATVYLRLLLCDDPILAHGARQALSRVMRGRHSPPARRRVWLRSPVREEDEVKPAEEYPVDPAEPMGLRPSPAAQPAAQVNPLEALLGAGVAGGFPPLLDIPPDADDEAMVELAIALSLQEHQMGGERQGRGASRGPVEQARQGEQGHYSDTTASAGGSDDEGSTAATDGSTLRTSPAEQGGSAGSESGGSGVESITGEHNVSGRSSAYGDNIQEAITLVSRSDTSSVTNTAFQVAESESLPPEPEIETESAESTGRLQTLRLQLLEKLIEYLPKLRTVGGVRAVPYLQVVLQLTADLDPHSEQDRAMLNSLLEAIIQELELDKLPTDDVCTHTKQKEVQLVLLRLLSVFMSRCKSSSSSTGVSGSGASSSSSSWKPVSSSGAPGDNCSMVSKATATALQRARIIEYCNRLLQQLLEYWRHLDGEESPSSSGVVGGSLLKEHLPHPAPDMTPFFVKQFVKEHATDVFRTYPQLLTEMALRLPYQVHKHSEISEPVSQAFDYSWFIYLCEYMMTSHVPFVRRQVRKLLLFICGNKDKYRQLRDMHALNTHIEGVREICVKAGYLSIQDSQVMQQHTLSMPYDSLVELVEHLKACLEIAASRTGNWQKYCINHDDIISFLLRVSFLLDEGVAPTILHLILCAIVVNYGVTKKSDGSSKQQTSSRKEREKSDDSATEAVFEESNCLVLVSQINKRVSKEVFVKFIKTFMLETNVTSVRWQAHGLILAIYRNSSSSEQYQLLELLWLLWPLLPTYGRKAAQFVDLLGYFSLRYSQSNTGVPEVNDYIEKAISVLRTQNELLAYHPNANLYAHMSQFVDLEGYYLESDPCLVCNNPEVSFTTIKLSSIKVDSKFTTTMQIVKLLSSHTISKITVRIGDLKRTKMVRTINIYYNNRNVQAVVELKNKPALWHKAKKVVLQSGQSEVKIEFPLPIIACNLMVEYADFYENIQASSETLQCPRCSAAVPSNPGVCANCGENVFQCHKCRAINYDEKDPFLCHACGFCKYAKFDFTLLAKACCAVEPIENDDDRKKTVSSINSLLEKADRVYKQLIANKPTLEALVLKITERSDKKLEDSQSTNTNSSNAPSSAVSSTSTQVKVNKTIQMLAHQYCSECKTSFEELSKIIQKVLVSRKELVAYDCKHQDREFVSDSSSASDQSISTPDSDFTSIAHPSHGRCYGCATAATEHCLTILRALATNPTTRQSLCSKGLIQELVTNNLRRGSTQIQEEVRQLLCVLTRDNAAATDELCRLIMDRIMLNLTGHLSSSDLGSTVRHEVALLSAMVQKEDECWEMKLRCMMRLFLKACEDSRNPVIMESVILPCLRILHGLMRPAPENAGAGKKTKDKTNAASTKKSFSGSTVDVYKWLNEDPQHTFVGWKARVSSRKESTAPLPTGKKEVHDYYLMEKYGRKWKLKVRRTYTRNSLQLDESAWLKAVLFAPSSRVARQVVCHIIELMCNNPERKQEVLILLTCFLSELTLSAESSAEFLSLYHSLSLQTPWKQYLTLHGVLRVLAQLITKEIEHLHRLERATLSSDLAQGYALNQLVELLAGFMEDAGIRRVYKGRLVGAVLGGYLSLRRLVVQRTRLVDETQEKLLELLEEMTSGTEEETKAFMSVCIETIDNYSLHDFLTPVFIFERLCSIVYPEENDIGEFYLTLEKDPQQEDFLQGRMLGNPYSSLEAGLGPLMRDVKNKICQDCELVALLEDDNGMELLVNNKIMSLDLPVKDVYKKVWLAEGGEADSMRIVYRMRGLLGDATEEFVETLTNKSQNTVDNEEVYKMANILADYGGLTVMVKRLSAIQNVWRAKPLLQVLLKLFRLSVKVNKCQEVLIKPELGAMEVFLRTLQLCLEGEPDSSQAAVTEQLLDIMETILSKATSQSFEDFTRFSLTFGGPEYVKALLTCTTHPNVRNNQSVLTHLTRVLAALVYGNEEKMTILLDHFKSVLDFNKYDYEHVPEAQQKLEMFCVLTDGIERNAIGNTLKDYVISLGAVRDALEYINMHAPCVKPTLLRTDSDELKEFISKPALKYILRFLTGLAHSHEKTQLAIAEAETIPIIHRLEQVSSDEHVGSLAENLLEALCTNPTVAKQIEEVREFTRSEKKRLAMAMREKQLGQLGMRTNDKGQVTAKSTILTQMEEIGEESGLVCCICREGYKYQPQKVLGIYTFTKRCNVDEYEAKPRKTVGYTTVTHFNIVHVDCHMSAVRLARARDEWESAALQNANTKCNGLLPLWGPAVPESAFASCLARHNAYLQEATGHRDIGHQSTAHDLKLLLWRFACERPFHEDTGGGGPTSNMHLVPYLVHVALYVINTTRVHAKESTSVLAALDPPGPERWVESSFEAEGPVYWIVMSVMVHSAAQWQQHRIAHLRRLLVCAHARHFRPPATTPSTPAKVLVDPTEKEWSVYKPYAVMWGLVSGMYSNLFKNVTGSDDQWPNSLADFIRHNDEILVNNSERLLSYYTDELLPCASFPEFCDVAGLLDDISNPETYISDLLKGFS